MKNNNNANNYTFDALIGSSNCIMKLPCNSDFGVILQEMEKKSYKENV